LLRLRYIGNTCGIIEKEIPEEVTYEKDKELAFIILKEGPLLYQIGMSTGQE